MNALLKPLCTEDIHELSTDTLSIKSGKAVITTTFTEVLHLSTIVKYLYMSHVAEQVDPNAVDRIQQELKTL